MAEKRSVEDGEVVQDLFQLDRIYIRLIEPFGTIAPMAPVDGGCHDARPISTDDRMSISASPQR
jgi:hypothetical protein